MALSRRWDEPKSHPRAPYFLGDARLPEHKLPEEAVLQHETPEHMFVNGSMLDSARYIVNVLRDALILSAAELFRKGVDGLSSVADDNVFRKVAKEFTDALWRLIAVYVSSGGTTENTNNFMRKGVDPVTEGQLPSTAVRTNKSNTFGSGFTQTFSGPTSFGGSETHTGTETHGGTETHNGNVTFNGDVTLGSSSADDLVVDATETHNGPEQHNGTVEFNGAANFDAPVDIDDTLDVLGEATFRGGAKDQHGAYFTKVIISSGFNGSAPGSVGTLQVVY